MEFSTYRISLDVHSVQSQVSLPIKEGDTSRKIYITLCEGGLPFKLTDDCFAVFSALKPDGNPIENNCIIEGNTIRYDVTEQTSAAVGKLDCELKLYGLNSQLITSPRFTIIVDPRATQDSEIVSLPEYTALTQLYSDTNAVKNEVETKLANGDFDGVGIESVIQTTESSEDGGENTVTVTLTNGNESAFNFKNGSKGSKGDPGAQGEKGDKGDTGAKGDKGDTGAQGIQGEKGDKGDKGDTGAAGYTPVKGTDYWTDADKTEIVNAVIAALPDGSEVSY